MKIYSVYYTPPAACCIHLYNYTIHNPALKQHKEAV